MTFALTQFTHLGIEEAGGWRTGPTPSKLVPSVTEQPCDRERSHPCAVGRQGWGREYRSPGG